MHRATLWAASLFISSVLLILVPTIAFGAPAPAAVYDATPSTIPSNVASVGFEATQTSEFGDYVHLGGSNRVLDTVTVTMSDWAVYSDYASDARYSADTVSWTHPITLNIYSNHLDANGVPDTLLATKTEDVTIPWRPVTDPSCTGSQAGDWKDSDGVCHGGVAFNATFDLSGLNVILPDDVIVGIAYNTGDYGAAPIDEPGPYNSLNVGVDTNQTVSVGTDDNIDDVFWNTSTAGNYTDGGVAGVGIFRQDTNWHPNGTVNMQITATPYVNDPSQSQFEESPIYVRSNNAGDIAAIALVPAAATAAQFTFTQTDGSNVYTDVAGTEHLQAGQFPIPATGQHQYRVGVDAAAGAYDVTGEYEVGSTWYPITADATTYVLDNPVTSFVFPNPSYDVFRPSDNPARVTVDDTNDSFSDVVFSVSGTSTTWTVQRDQCDLREAGSRVLCDLSDASNWAGDLPDGTYTADAIVYNQARGNTEITSQQFTIDSSLPVVTNFQITNPTSVYGTEIDVSADVTDAESGIQNVDFYITAPRAGDNVCDGNGTSLVDSQITVPTSGNTYTTALDTSALTGTYCVNVVAENLASGHSAAQEIQVQIDNTPPPPSTITVTIDKYINGQPAAALAGGTSFPMASSWTSTLIGDGSGTYDLGTDDSYEAVTSPMNLGSTYTTNENLASSCTVADPFELEGYTTGDTLADAASATPTMTPPSFSDLESNQYVIVWNNTCPPAPTITSPINGTVTTTANLTEVDWTGVTDAAGGITYTYQVSTSPAMNGDGSFSGFPLTIGGIMNTDIPTPGTPPNTYYIHVQATDADGNTSAWSPTVEVTVDNSPPVSSADDITSFGFGLADETDNIVGTDIAVTVPNGTDVTNLIPTIVTSTSATVSPDSGVAEDFTNPVDYTVTAQDGTTQQMYTVTVTVAPSSVDDITSFNFGVGDEVDTIGAGTVDVTVPFGTDVTALTPIIAVSTGATVSPLSGVAGDFTSPQTYIVTAQDGVTTQSYLVTVTVAAQVITAPVADDQTLSTNDTTPLTVTLTASNSPTSWDVITQPTKGVLSGTAPDLTYTANSNFAGPDSFTFTADNGAGTSNTATISLTVNDTIAPVITVNGINPASVEVGATYSDLGVTATDNVDLSPVVMASVDDAASTTVANITIDTSTPGTHTIVYSATDEDGNVSYATRTIAVLDAPTVTLTSTSTNTTSDNPIHVVADFSEPVAAFDETDIDLSSDSLINFAQASSTEYSFDLIPNGANISATIDQHKFTNLAGGENETGATIAFVYSPLVAPSTPTPDVSLGGGGGNGSPVCGIGDLNCDGSVNIQDLNILLSDWGATGTNLAADLNHDGKVDFPDIAILLGHWTH